MNYSKLQKITSFWVIFVLLFSITFRIPFFGSLNQASAIDKDFYSLVSIIVNEDVYDRLSPEIKRYAKDIQGVLENTRAVILPVPNNVKQIDISSLNESLYFEGYKSIDDNVSFESKLIGTVLVGDLPVPVVSKNNKTTKTIFPYTDFEDKAYVYNHDSGFYEKNPESYEELRAEIWHGVISPNTGKSSSDISSLKDYFDKNHDFYSGTGNFKLEDDIINGNLSDQLADNYEPYVFYFDQFREEKSLHYPAFKAYEAYSENREDVTYYRYSTKLAEAIKQSVLGAENESIGDLLSRVTGGAVGTPSNSLGNASDISTRTVIQKATKQFVEIFNGGQIEDLRTNVHNAGRYNKDGSKVNVDFIPYLISTLDVISDEVVKSANTDLEGVIDDMVVGGLARNIALPIFTEKVKVKSVDLFDIGLIDIISSEKYVNFLHGRDASTIEGAEQCSIYRGSSENGGNLVESNRGFNIKNTGPDAELCGEGGENSQGLWGGNSPINGSSQDGGPLVLGSRDLTLSITPLFDILGSKAGGGEVNSPLSCYDHNPILAIKKSGGLLENTDYDYKIPEPGETMGIKDGEEVNWCPIDNIKQGPMYKLEELYNDEDLGSGACGKKVVLDGEGIIAEDLSLLDGGGDLSCEYYSFYFKSIPSYVFHKSPTKKELKLEIANPVTPNLAIDRNRYVDFIGANGEYRRIDYPNFFRVGSGSIDLTQGSVTSYLSEISGGVNSIVSDNAGASGDIYDLLGNGEFEGEPLDLVGYLKSKPAKTITIGGETKEVNYYDFLVFSTFWQSLTNTSAKYKFIMENYLSDEFGGNKYNFLLPKAKRQYEMAYLGAPGDSSHMYVKLDPDAKGENPFVDVISSNSKLDSNLIGVKTISNDAESQQGLFKCAPPEGVPIWEWIPAVVCWINNMLPPTIGISEGTCGSSFLTKDEIDDISNYEEENNCKGDLNHNGVNDCVENVLEKGSLSLSKDVSKYHYKKAGKLKVTLIDSYEHKVLIDSQSYVHFYIKDIKDIDGNSIYKEGGDIPDNIQDYISFNDIDVRLNYGEATHSFTTGSKDAKITFGVKLENEGLSISLEDDIDISITGDSLSLDSSSVSSGVLDTGSNITKAGTNIYLYDESKSSIGDIDDKKDGLFIGASNKSKTGEVLNIEFPVDVEIIDSFGEKQFSSSELTFSTIAKLETGKTLEKTGVYDLVVRDATGFVVTKEIEVIAGSPEKLDLTLGSTVLEKGGAVTTNIVTISDKFDNPVTGEYYDLDLELSGDSLEFVENDNDEISYKTFEGFRAFRIKSTDNTGSSEITIKLSQDGKDLLSSVKSKTIKVIDKVKLNISGTNNLKVGKNIYKFDIDVTDDSKTIDDLNSRIYLNISSKYGKTLKPYYELKNGKATIDFQTAYLAGKDIPFEFQIEGLSNIQKEYFDILPEKPLKIDLKSSKTRMEAKQGNTTTIKAELKDAYGNLVFNDNTTSLNLEIPERYESIVTLGNKTKIVSGGKASFTVNATDNPGSAYIKITSDPDLSSNFLEIKGQAPFSKGSLSTSFIKDGKLTDLGKEFFYDIDSENVRSKFNTKQALKNNPYFEDLSQGLKNRLINLWENKNTFSIFGVGGNTIKIETYFFWTKDNIVAKKYNALYTTLLGAPYGDFTKKDYLAGGLLFDKNNKSLAVTSLFNNPYLYNDIVQITGKGSVKKSYNSSDLTQDININLESNEDNIPYLDIFNNALTTYIGKIFFNFDKNTKLLVCEGEDCNNEFENDTIFIEQSSSNYSFELDDDLKITNSIGETLFRVDNKGNIQKHPNISIELNNSDSKSTLFDIKISNKIIGKMGFYFSGDKDIKIVKKGNKLKNILAIFKSSLVVNLETDDYSIRDILSAEGGEIKSIYYLDPFSKKYTLNTFSRENPYSYENFALEGGLGWKGGNKSLLDFAAGKNVGDSVKGNASIGVITLGDPVVSLKKKKADLPGTITPRKFDRTIGKKLNKYGISSYQVFDYNNDEKDDILLIGEDGFFKLLENKDIHENILNQRNLAKVEDLGSKDLVLAGDFSGDGYEDIFFVNNDGNPYLLNNKKKDFTRVDLTEEFDLGARIVISKVFDMDNDGIDDLILLDDSGKITIFYGSVSDDIPSFTKKEVSNNQGISVNLDPRSDLGAVYFDGVRQTELTTSSGSEVNQELLNSQLFIDLPYNSGNENIDNGQDLIGNIPSGFSSDLGGNVNNLGGDIGDLTSTYSGSVNVENSNPTVSTKFIRSQYADMLGLRVEKVFTDLNGSTLKTNDEIGVEITLTNTLRNTLNNIAYLDEIPEIFTLDNNPEAILTGLTNTGSLEVKPGIGDYSFLVDKFSLSPGESVNIKYNIKTKAIKYGFIEVGLFEEGEVGNDEYGDIIFKMNEKNCSETVSIFRSTASRDYESGEKEPTCDEAKLQLPDNLENNNLDTNNNGIPDYMDQILEGDSDVISGFSEQTLEDFYHDTDEDGIPDLEDNSPNFNSDNLVGNITNIDVDAISEGMDNLIEGFGCGFGGGSCLSLPLNWAPLAPGNDPVILGRPVGDGLRTLEGIPFFSYPLWGGGIYGPHVGVRMFYTPTLTGANGLAVCYGDNVAAGNLPPIGLSPIVPGGNCIVAAYPMNFCSDKEVNGDPRSIGTPSYFSEFGIINGNCSAGSSGGSGQSASNNSFVEDNLNYENLIDGDYSNVFSEITGTNYINNNQALFSMNGGNSGLADVSVDLDLGAIGEGNFQDVIKVKNKRVAAFPGFLMDWLTRQIEEIVNKLTDFPTVSVILPDLDGIFNGDWGDYINKGLDDAYNKGIDNKNNKNARYDSRIKSLKDKKTGLKCEGDDKLSCANIDLEIAKLERKKGFGFEKQYSGIKQAYEFLGSVPFVSINPEVVPVNIPWMDKATLNKAITDWKLTAEQWKQELSEAKDAWSLGVTCDNDDQECKDKNKLVVDVTALIASLERNIAILEDYKNFPEKLASLVNKKQEWLEQITCNIDSISYITGGWIGKNGERFKAWVELYVLIKAILKSWQLLADIFIDFDAECHECKNERYDLIGFFTKLVDFIIPKIPVVKFPKWPDIVLDLHNIRANLDIRIPEFDFNLRPIVLPILPELNLPDVPSITFGPLPELPIFEVPELPDIPTLPKIELPDLPPPPTLPKIFASLEGVLDVLKLVTKAMCILKKSPFVPEWRAGDQISFLTERSGYLNFDFLDLTLPQFSYPFVDSINITSYVNLEFETDFLVEMARNISIPLNGFTNNVVNMFDVVPHEIDIKGPDDITVNPSALNIDNTKVQTSLESFIKLLTAQAGQLSKNILEQSKDELTSAQFSEVITRELAKPSIAGNPAFDEIRKTWSTVNAMTYSKENKLIQKLLKANADKFDAIMAIIDAEKEKNKSLLKKVKSLDKPIFARSIVSNNVDDFNAYNKTLNVYNDQFKQAAKNLIIPGNSQKQELEDMGKSILDTIDPVLSTKVPEGSKQLSLASPNIGSNKLLAASNNNSISSVSGNSCQAANAGTYTYNYKGIYVVEGNISYNLFDYFDELNGKEQLIEIDIDSDSDMDLLYQMGNDLYLKENLDNTATKNYITSAPLLVSANNNKFVNGDTYYEAVNSFKEISTSSNSVNVSFKADNRKEINNYRLEYFTIVDKYLNKDNSGYIPEKIKKNIIDAFAGSDELGEEKNEYKTGKNIAYVRNAGGNLSGVNLKTKALKNISKDFGNNKFVVLSPNTKLYSGGSSVTVKYLLGEDTKEVLLDRESYIQFKDTVKLYTTQGADAYVATQENVIYKGGDIISKMLHKPLVFGSSFEVDNDATSGLSYIELKYYDGSELSLDFSEVESYKVYDLGYKDTSYLINLDKENDYYYARIHSFTENIDSTYSRQIILSPQRASDQTSPDFDFNNKIKIPVYQEKIVDFSDYVSDNSQENVTLSIGEEIEPKFYEIDGLKVTFGKFDTIFTKNIKITLTDSNGNTTSKDIELEVYAPVPQIESYNGGVVGGSIDEALSDEPVTVYRIRGGGIKKLGVNNTDPEGIFNMEVPQDDSGSGNDDGIELQVDNDTILTIDESSGLISILQGFENKYYIEIESKNSLDYPEILVKKIVPGEDVNIYSGRLRLDGSSSIKIVDNFESIIENGLYLDINNNNLKYYKIPDTARYNPGALVIYKGTNIDNELFVISPDGRMKVSSNFSLKYDKYEDENGNKYVVFKMMENSSEIGKILFKIENGFLIR